MAKRASLTFDAMKGSKAAPAAEAAPVATPAQSDPQEKRGRGRPIKRDPDTKVYGMTLRIPGDLRKALRHLAEDETEKRGRIVSVHDVILQAVETHLSRKGVRVGE